MSYSFGVPGYVVWTSHILIGLYLIYVGWTLQETKKIDKYSPIILIVLGTLAALYHAHIWLNHLYSKNK